ncbi:MAG TPA: orotidine-5'-phosphate decarboxylase [Terriglobales bacterium]|nr:orotidine-5'-phosphate decarboxylase [Terriglobales bacterium]
MTFSANPESRRTSTQSSIDSDRLIVALDVRSAAEAQRIVAQLGDRVRFYKVGMQLYTAEGPAIVRELVRSGHRVFLDLKYHDIPNTVASAVREAAQLGVSMLTVHASGGKKMLAAAVEGARSGGRPAGSSQSNSEVLKILAVTVLTSMDQQDLNQVGVAGAVMDQVARLASMARDAGCSGVVSSAHEAQIVRKEMGIDFLVVTPGVRPAGSQSGDQARVVTPADAIAAGASHIVVGRPITSAQNPAAAARSILEQMQRIEPKF